MRTKLLAWIRKHVGFYCTDAYWLHTIDGVLAHQPHPILWFRDHLSELAIHAVATDYTSKTS